MQKAHQRATRVLISPELVSLISTFQDGVHEDMLPFLEHNIRRRNQLDLYPQYWETFDVKKFHDNMANTLHPRMGPWLAQHGVRRLPKLFGCLPFMHGLVLEYAAWSGNSTLLAWFSTNGGIGCTNPQRQYLYAIAANQNHLNTLEFLHASGYREVMDSDTIVRAIQPDHLSVVRFLLDHFVVSEMSEVFLEAAIKVGGLALVRYFADTMPATFKQNPWFVACAAKKGHADIVLALIALGFNGSDLTMDAAAQGGSMQLVQHLYDLGDYKCTTSAMNGAACNGHVEMVRWLHENEYEGCTDIAISGAAEYGQLDIVDYLRAEYPDAVNLKKLTRAAAWGAESGKWAALPYLLEHKLCTRVPVTTLTTAAGQGRVDMAQWLLANQTTFGFQIDCTTDTLDKAASNGHLAMLEWLHQNYPAVKCTTLAVRSAVENGHVEVVQWLLTHGYVTDLNASAQSMRQATALLSCPQNGIVKLGVDLCDAMSSAASLGHVKMIRWLLQSNTHVCACDILRRIETTGQDDLMAHVLRKKAHRCGKCIHKEI
ncbi:Aste57867_18540 [Aphanomyces stellatus]|uniref:Aste57867_18540 protein n=1 Tax=Aphanomyces stellatus TaxID=120398 RepID=A0A485LAP8_9STRA|nr:hypothetical protein As57867_018478 [Aphanomyces stellatus]VFT95276.1 Aste57867_18540 [Aphanomyces stellatus]